MEADEVRVQPQEVQVETQPTDDQAKAFLNGDRSAVEQQKEQPKAQAEATPPAASTTSVQSVDTAKLLQELNQLKSEMGQFRKMRSELSQRQETKPAPPASWAQMTPEQQKELRDLVKLSLEGDDDWKAVQTSRQQFAEMQQQQQMVAQIQGVESLAKQYAGDLHSKLDPIMGRMYEEFKKKADEGDEESAQLIHEFKTTRTGIKYLVDLAKQEYSQSIEAKGEQAKTQQAAQARKAGVTLGASTVTTQQPDILKNLPKDPAAAAELLRDELVKRGAL